MSYDVFINAFIEVVQETCTLKDMLRADTHTTIIAGEMTDNAILRMPLIKNEVETETLYKVHQNEQRIRVFLIDILRGKLGMYKDALEIDKLYQENNKD